jgi:O-antigen/teichoic acid export membrane protein
VVPVRTFASRAILTFGTNLGVALISLVNVLLVSRVLGASGRGDVAFLTTIAFLGSNLATIGVQESNSNIGGADPDARRALATNSVVLAALFGAASIGVLSGLIALFPAVGGPSNAALRWLVLAAIPMLILQLYLRSLAQSTYGFAVTNTAWLLGPVVNIVGNGVAALVGVLTVETAVGTWIAGQLLGTILLAWWIATRQAGFGRPDLRLVRRSIGFGARSHAGRVMLLGNYRLDQWIVGAIAGSRQLGLYSVAVAWAEALFYLPTALSLVQRPDLVRASKPEAARQTAVAFRASVIVTLALAVGMFLTAPFLCVTIFGPDFRGSVVDLRVLTVGAFGIVALKQFGNALTAQQRPLLATAATAVAFAVTTALDFVLIPAHGGLGAAYASTIAYLVGGVAITFVFLRALDGRVAQIAPRPRDVVRMWERLRLRRLVGETAL